MTKSAGLSMMFRRFLIDRANRAERLTGRVHRETCRPQGERHSPEVWHSSVNDDNAGGDVVNKTEANTKEEDDWGQT